ncbi:MAG: phosphoglucomutase/phosphomannomutase alpha/beta/alpha domain [Chthoniobacteraceae bacterium]|nr:phosphoglucomutase/phosphomannomutase alpha/beta/alpha domain [Chthoniobacteraceae bacterium]
MSDLSIEIERAVQAGQLRQSSAKNIEQMLVRTSQPSVLESITELVNAGAWEELDDRFFKTLAFGTGGLRGRTIGKIVTAAERGEPQPLDRPQRPCAGTNAMNFFNVSRATQGLVAYLKEWLAKEQILSKPKIVVAHDTRYFSRDFAELTARVAMDNGCDVCLFEGPRSTPQLSFTVRQQNAFGGIVITASHNPSHDNGYKVYFSDGAQVVEPHASAIIAKVNAIESDVYEPLPEDAQGTLTVLGKEIDEAYMERLETLVLDRPMVESAKDLQIVFTSIHGTGGAIIKPMLDRLGFRYSTVPAQEIPDGRFPTVKSPNPENAEALSKAIELANEVGADLVMATDPDCDRMGVAARNREGVMELFSGNQIGSLMAYYRVKKLIEQRVITSDNARRCVIIKTFVTTDLQKAIAQRNGLRCVETLTGFKYIGEKLGKYEAALPIERRMNYRMLPEIETRLLRLNHSSYYVCGGEESYGYSAADFIRDKDGNGAVVVFAEVAAYAKSRGLTLDQLLDEIYSDYGFYLEQNGNLTFEGAEGASKIQKLVTSYASQPPGEADQSPVTELRNFAEQDFVDIEGDKIPKEKMLMIDLADGRRFAVRPSGTEPKIKFYMFGRRLPQAGRGFTESELTEARQEVTASLASLWRWIQADVEKRLGRDDS